MSVIDTDGLKILLPRCGPDEFWSEVLDRFTDGDPRRWRHLAMLALRETAEWPLDRIGEVFGHTKGHVQRCIKKVREEIRAMLADGESKVES